jgi:hypothetical protein
MTRQNQKHVILLNFLINKSQQKSNSQSSSHRHKKTSHKAKRIKRVYASREFLRLIFDENETNSH